MKLRLRPGIHPVIAGRGRMKEATARIKINKLLEAAGWRFFPASGAAANIRLEPSVAITAQT